MTTVVLVQQGGTGANSVAAARAALSVPSSSDVVSKSGDTMTGQLNISSGGLLVSGNANFDSGTLVVNSVNNRVGIGITNPAGLLHVDGSDVYFMNGNFGVGTTAPEEKFHLKTSGYATIKITSTTNYSAGLLLQPNNSNQGRIESWYNDKMYIASDYSISIHAGGFFGSTYERMFISNTGNIGIGTNTPTANLHITGTIIDTPIVSITGNQTYADNAAGKVIFSNTTSAVTVTIAAAATTGFSYTVIRGNTGNVTIANSGVTRLNSASITTMNLNQYGAATVVYTATNQVIVFGDFVA